MNILCGLGVIIGLLVLVLAAVNLSLMAWDDLEGKKHQRMLERLRAEKRSDEII